jgi:hypothetical protein
MGPTLPIVIALKNPSPSAGFEPANLGFTGKHAKHYTTEDDHTITLIIIDRFMENW